MAWLYMPDMADLTLACKSLAPDTALFVTLSGKQVVRPCSWRGWKRRSYIKRLYGTIAEPSMAGLGAVKWISSLPVSRVLPFPSPASETASRMTNGCGMMSSVLFAKWSHERCFLKTSGDCFLQMMGAPSLTFLETWPPYGSMLSGEVFRQKPWEPRMAATGYSSWPTPAARMVKGGGKAVMREDGKSRLDMLDWAAEQWATPRAMTGGGNSNRHNRPNTGGPDLQEQVTMWATPNAADSIGTHGGGQDRSLRTDVSLWATPISNDAEKRGKVIDAGLTGMVVDFHSRRLDLMTKRRGATLSSDMKPRLSPQFTEWLMGLPSGWTDYECAETGFSRWLQHMRGELDRLCLGENDE